MKYYRVRFLIKNENLQDLEDYILTSAKDVLSSLLGDIGFESFEEKSSFTLDAYIEQEKLLTSKIDSILTDFPFKDLSICYDVFQAEYEDFNKVWEEEGFLPIWIADNLVIHDLIHPINFEKNKPKINIIIDAKLAFGTGQHETTFMIINELLTLDVNSKKVLDCGSGTGILSLLASFLGAKNIFCYDIDEWSVNNTKHNALLNKVNNIRAFQGDSSILDNSKELYDIILANINLNILLEDLPKFFSKMNDNAVLLLSGFFQNDEEILEEKAKSLGLVKLKSKRMNSWSMLEFKKKK